VRETVCRRIRKRRIKPAKGTKARFWAIGNAREARFLTSAHDYGFALGSQCRSNEIN